MLEIHFRFCSALHYINQFAGFLFFPHARALEVGQQWVGLSSWTDIEQLVLFSLLGLSWHRSCQSFCKATPFVLLSETHDMSLGLQHCFQSN